MLGFLLIAPTGSGKSWVCENDPFFSREGVDGDSLIQWPHNWNNVDWTVQDRKNIDVVLDRMRRTSCCVLWYVGTTAIADALIDERLTANQLAIVLPPQAIHRQQVDTRRKRGHDWNRACEHRALCENLIERFELPHFDSFQAAVEHVRTRINNKQ